MGYQEECEDFAMFGDPAREAFEYELNAERDYYTEAYGDSSYIPDEDEEWDEWDPWEENDFSIQDYDSGLSVDEMKEVFETFREKD